MSNKRTQIQQAAIDAIKKHGFKSVSFRTLAEEVGVKSSSVHYHFKTKDDLAEDVIRSYTEAFIAELEDIDRRETRLSSKLDAFNALFVEVLRDDDICLCGMLAAEVASIDASARLALKSFFQQAETWLEQTLEAHADELRTPIGPADLARVLMAGLEGATLIDRVDAGGDRLAAFRNLTRSLIG